MPTPRVASSREDGEEADSESGATTPEVEIDPSQLQPDDADVSADEPVGETETIAEEPPADDDAVLHEELAEPVFTAGEPEPGADFFDATDDVDDDPPRMGEPDFSRDAGPGPSDDTDESERKAFEESINAGFARLAVLGLDEEFEVNGKLKAKDDLRVEFREVFEEFQLGHYGDQVMKEYLLKDDDDIDPIWGFTGALILCFGLTIYMRPDGDEILDRTTTRLSGLGGRFKR